MDCPKFSIIIVTYDSGGLIDRVLDCLDAQSLQDFETIILDNNSMKTPLNESQKARASKFIQNDENIGFARANNKAALLARGDYLILLNPDAFAHSDWLFEINKATDKYKNCQAFGSLQLMDGIENMLDGAGDCMSIFGIAWRGGHRKPIEALVDSECFSPCAAAAIWQKSRYLQLGGFCESFNSYYEDVDLGFRHRIMGGKSIQLSNAIVSHRGSGSSSRYSEYAVFHGTRNRIWAFFRNMPLWGLILPLFIAANMGLWLHSIIRGAGKPYFNGLIAGISGIPAALHERKTIYRNNNANFWQIMRPIAFSPLSLLKRAIVLRPIK